MKSNQRKLKDGTIITLKLGREYGSVTGRRFRAVEVYRGCEFLTQTDVVVRANANDGLETRASIIYWQALNQLRLETGNVANAMLESEAM